MKKVIAAVVYIAFITVFLPMIIICISDKISTEEKKEYINVYIAGEDRVEKMNVSQYLKEVTAAEMPADFHIEALKAQAVAARTYLRYKIKKGNYPPEHKGAPICTDYHHCKAWLSEKERKNAWQADKRAQYWDKISKAVDETEGKIMMYDGEPINAVFHSTSSGMTENAKDVWGGDVAYLVSVDSRGDELSPKFSSEFSCSADEYKKRIFEKIPSADDKCEPFSDIQRSTAGGIIQMKVYGVQIKGTEFRSIFDLCSTNVQINSDGSEIKMTVKGNGHGVGMSQYGADYFAREGMTYKDILEKYYTGATLSN